MSYRSDLAIQFKNANDIEKITKDVDKAIKKCKWCDETKSYIIRNPKEIIHRPDDSIIYIWEWLNECDDEFSPFYDTIKSGDYDLAIARVGENSDDAEEICRGDIDFNCEVYLDRTVYTPPNWENFKFDTLPHTKSEAKFYANDWQTWQSTQNLSYEEINNFGNYFQLLGDFYNLTDEFKENGAI